MPSSPAGICCRGSAPEPPSISSAVIGVALAAGSILIRVPRLVLIPDQHGEYWASLRTRGRLAFATVWTVMALYLCLAGVLALLWL